MKKDTEKDTVLEVTNFENKMALEDFEEENSSPHCQSQGKHVINCKLVKV